MEEILIGTCGYGYFQPPGNWEDRYKSKLQAFSHAYRVGEINRTFYKLPMVKTAEKWRRQASKNFEFTIKTWQAITHPTSSPTWRKRKDTLSDRQMETFGNFQPDQEVLNAWEETKARAEALNANICVFQTPGSFNCTDEHKQNISEFMAEADRGELAFAWEPRGDWKEYPETIQTLCDELNLIHIVDVLRDEPVSNHPVAYIRLHGLNDYPYDYNYDYSDTELSILADKLTQMAESHEKIYCMFNNFKMYKNADRLKEILSTVYQ